MLEITVKTLDGRNRTFDVDDNITVKQFKETIAPSIEIEAEVQRLIYRGKVLIDDKKINDYDVNGKTLHVVQRAPPQANQQGSSGAGPSSSRTNISEGLPQGIHIEMIPENDSGGQSVQSESRKRIKQATRMLNLAKEVMSGLEQSSNDSTPTEERMDVDEGSASQESSEEQQQPQTTGAQPEDQTDPPTGALADLLDEVLKMNERMEGHIRLYRDIMRNQTTEPVQEGQSLESVCQETSKAMHLMSHVYHNLSDLFCDFDGPLPRRLRAFSPPMRQATTIIQQTIPVQVSAQFNVSPVLRENPGTTTTAGATATQAAPPSVTTTSSSSAPTTQSSTPRSVPLSTTVTSSASPPFNTIISELNRIIGGDVQNFQFPMPGSGQTSGSRASPAAAAMFVEMGSSGSGTVLPEQTSSSSTSTTTSTSSDSGGRSANITVTGSGGSTPGFLNDDFIQNIIQVATGVALQNGGAQRPQFVMLGPQLAFMGSGQRGQAANQRRRTARRAADGSSQAAPTDGQATGTAPTSGGSPRGLREIIIDPCLPCNSWHFGHRRQNPAAQGAQANSNERQQQQRTSSQPPPLSNFPHFQNIMGMAQDFFTSLTRQNRNTNSQSGRGSDPLGFTRVFGAGNTLDNILNTLSTGQNQNQSQSEGLLSDLISALAPHVTFGDLFNFILGQSSSLRRVRVPLQAFVRDNLLGRRPATEENVEAAAERIVAGLQQDIQEIAESVQVNENIDFAASVRSYLKSQFVIIIKLIINATDDAEFADQLFDSMNDLLHGLVNLCRCCLRDGDRAIEAIVQNRIRSVYAEVNPGVTPFMSQWMMQLLQSRLPNVPRTEEHVVDHVLRKRAAGQGERGAPVGGQGETDGDSTESYATVLEEVMEEDPVPATLVNGEVGEESFVASTEAHRARLTEEVLSRLPPPPTEEEGLEFEADLERNDRDDSWKSVVPKEWVPVIAKDAARQRRQASDPLKEPISDAYMYGIPAKRRKIMKERNHLGALVVPGTALANDLTESIRQAAGQVNCQPLTSFQDVKADLEGSHDLLSAYREELAKNSDRLKDSE